MFRSAMAWLIAYVFPEMKSFIFFVSFGLEREIKFVFLFVDGIVEGKYHGRVIMILDFPQKVVCFHF